MSNKIKLAILIAIIPFIILGIAVYYAFQYPEPITTLGAPAANLTRDIAPIFNATSTISSTFGNYEVGSSTAYYFGIFSRYASTTEIDFASGTATSTLRSSASSTLASGIQLQGTANICLSNGTCLGGGGGGITSLNGLTGATQTFTAQGGLVITSAGTDHVFNASTSPGFGFLSATSTTRISELQGGLRVTNNPISSSSTATSTFAGGINIDNTGGLSSASGLTITGGSILQSNTATNTLSGLGVASLTVSNGVVLTGGQIFSSGTGTSTFAGGLSLSAGCFAIGSTCTVNSVTGGRSLTVSGSGTVDLAADAELFTHIVSFNVASSSMSTTTRVGQHKFASAVTISRISCSSSNGTSTVQFDERAEGTSNTAGTDVLSSALSCGSGSNTDASTSFGNATIAADAILNLQITDASPTGNKPTQLFIHVDYAYDD